MYYLISKPDCRWCKEAKDLLKSHNEDFTEYDYQEHPMIIKLMFEAALKTVPQIWYKGTHIGGYEELTEWLEKTT